MTVPMGRGTYPTERCALLGVERSCWHGAARVAIRSTCPSEKSRSWLLTPEQARRLASWLHTALGRGPTSGG